MKRIISIVLVTVMLAFCLSGCTKVISQNTITDTAKYSDIFEWAENNSELKLFPANISNYDVPVFYANQLTYLLLTSGYEIVLQIQYTDSEYDTEVQRISTLKDKESVYLDTEHFNKPAYVAMLGDEECNEYAFADDETKTVTYVYLQYKSEDEIQVLTEALLPIGYYPADYDTQKTIGFYGFSIYK